MQPINFQSKFDLISQYWTPKILMQFGDYYMKVAKMKGEFIWHRHTHTDEVFLVHSGHLQIHLRDRIITLSPGECFVIPCGVEHKPVALDDVCCIILAKAGTINTGDTPCEKTISQEDWL